MLPNNDTTKLLGLEGILVESVENAGEALKLHISGVCREHNCPSCRHKTKYIHDYRIQRIKDLHIRGKPVILELKKRRYICKECGKKFFERLAFLPKYHRMTQRVYESIIHSMRENYSMKSIAAKHNVSTNTVSRVFDIVSYNLYRLPRVLAFDEFKGNAGGQKYQAILTDPSKKRVLDILHTREQTHLIDYFKQFKDRNRVEFVIMDMWQPYLGISNWMFPNAKVIVDKYHYVRQVYWALENVRKRVQKRFSDEKRIYFKHSKKLLWAEFDKLSDERRQALQLMLSQSYDLHMAWQLKELFVSFRHCNSSQFGRKLLRDWILTAQETKLPEFVACTTAFTNWFNEILNSLDYPYSNGFTEGINNKIKVIKRNAFGFRNFYRFRNRILHCCN